MNGTFRTLMLMMITDVAVDIQGILQVSVSSISDFGIGIISVSRAGSHR